MCQRLISDLSCGVFQCSPLIEGLPFSYLSAEALLGWSIYCTLLESAFFLWVVWKEEKPADIIGQCPSFFPLFYRPPFAAKGFLFVLFVLINNGTLQQIDDIED